MGNDITKAEIEQYRSQKCSGDLVVTTPYDYTDENGTLLFQAVREQYEKGKKFYQRRPDGKGGWINSTKGMKTTIYRLPEVIEAVKNNKTIFIVEGEKDVETLRELQLTATTNPMGAGKWRSSYNKYLKNADVAILPDNDLIGKKHAENIAEGLTGIARSVKLVELPDLEEHEDVTDWLQKRGGTKEKLLKLVEETKVYSETFRRICLTLGKSDKNTLPVNAEKACKAIEKLGTYYWKAGMARRGLGEVLINHDGVPYFHLMGKDEIFNAVCRVAYSENKKGLPPKEIAGYIYEMPAIETPFKPLEKVIRVPIFSSTGQLICEPGYYGRDRLLYVPYNNNNIRVSVNPTKEEIQAAKSLLEDDILVDFNFVSPADKTHAIAYILLFLCREMINGPTPLHIFEAAKQGTGKTLLAESLMNALTLGKYTIINKPDDNELRKQITSAVISGMSGFCLDNVIELKSPQLAQVLLTQKYNDRPLNTNDQIDTVIRWVWAATGNNIAVDTDIARRSIRIRFVCDEEHPELRSANRFKHPKLFEWCQSNVSRIIESGLTLIQAWIAAGRPVDRSVNYGGFESWAELIGGILAFHGFPAFLGNVKEFYEEADKDAFAWRDLLGVWWSTFHDKPVTAGDLLPYAVGVEGLYLGKDDRDTLKKNYLTRLLNSRKDTVTAVEINGETTTLKLKKERRSNAGTLWSLQVIRPKIKIYEPDETSKDATNPVVNSVCANTRVDSVESVEIYTPKKNFYGKRKEKNNRSGNFNTFNTINTEQPANPVTIGTQTISGKIEEAGINTSHAPLPNNTEKAFEKVTPAEIMVANTKIEEKNIVVASTRPLSDIERCIAGREIAIDLETTGLRPWEDTICVLSVACGDDYWIVQFPTKDLLKTVVDKAGLLIGHNLKFDLAFIRQILQERFAPKVFDTRLAAQLIEGNRRGEKEEDEKKKVSKKKKKKTATPDKDEIREEEDKEKEEEEHSSFYSLKEVAKRYLGINMDKGLQKSDWRKPLSPEQVEYCINDIKIPLRLYSIQRELLEKNKLQQAAELEFNCVPAVVEMELNGVPFDLEGGERLLENFVITHNFDFNPNSHQQIKEAFAELGYTLPNTTKYTLRTIDHPLAQQLLEYKDKKKARDALHEWCSTCYNGRIHPSFSQLGAKTGRFSCSHPNLQNVRKDKEFRQLFAAPEGHMLVDCDLSGIELRIMAWLCRDPKMVKAFNENLDLHKITAAAVLNKPVEEITKSERQLAKAINFGLIYGMKPKKFQEYAENEFGVKMTEEEAKRARNIFFQTYPKILDYHARIERLRPGLWHLPEGEKPMIIVRCASKRARIFDPNTYIFTRAVNHPDQGTGADMIKEALTRLYMDTHYKIILTVHDEIMLEVPEDEAERAKEVLRNTLIAAGSKLISPIVVDAEVGVGKTWADCK